MQDLLTYLLDPGITIAERRPRCGTMAAPKARPRCANSIWRKAGVLLLGNGRGGCPSAALVGRGPRGLATRMALCIAYMQPPLSREHIATLLVAIPTRPSPVTGWPPGRSTSIFPPIPPQAMLPALRGRLRLPLPLRCSRCGPPGCGGEEDALSDHAAATRRARDKGRWALECWRATAAP